MEYLEEIARIMGYVSAIVTALVMLIRPLRNKVLGISAMASGVRCLLRANMLRLYYKRYASDRIRQYERENFEAEYKAYKALGGNSLIDDIYQEVKTWEMET